MIRVFIHFLWESTNLTPKQESASLLTSRMTANSRIGFGTGGPPDDFNTGGNDAKQKPDNGEKHIKVIGYILVQ